MVKKKKKKMSENKVLGICGSHLLSDYADGLVSWKSEILLTCLAKPDVDV